jgi:hypothetical protein
VLCDRSSDNRQSVRLADSRVAVGVERYEQDARRAVTRCIEPVSRFLVICTVWVIAIPARQMIHHAISQAGRHLRRATLHPSTLLVPSE